MTPYTKIILITLLFGLLSAGATVLLLYIGLAEAVGGTFGQGLFGHPVIDIPIMFVGYYGSMLSFLICPVAAFYYRDIVLEATPYLIARVLIFAVMSTASLPVLGAGIYGIQLRSEWRSKRAQGDSAERQKVIDSIAGAGIEIVGGDAVITSEDENYAVASVTLQIRNLPNVVSEYDLSFVGGRNQDGLEFKLHHPRNTESYTYISAIAAKNENGSWVFYEHPSGRIISRDPESIPVEIQIRGLTSTYLQRTTTFEPILTIWRDLEGSPYENKQVWRKEIGLTIRRSVVIREDGPVVDSH